MPGQTQLKTFIRIKTGLVHKAGGQKRVRVEGKTCEPFRLGREPGDGGEKGLLLLPGRFPPDAKGLMPRSLPFESQCHAPTSRQSSDAALVQFREAMPRPICFWYVVPKQDPRSWTG